MPNLEDLFGGGSALLALIQLIYSAIDDSSLWPIALERISNLIGGDQILIWTRFQNALVDNIVAVARMDRSALDPYVSYYAAINVLAQRCDQLYRDGMARFSHRAVPDPEFRRTEFCNDYFHPNDMHYSIGMKIPVSDQEPAYLACMRPEKQQPFEEVQGLILELLMPHLKRALELHLRFSRLRVHSEGLALALDAFGHAVFGLDHHGRVVFSNRGAEQLLRAGQTLRLSKGRLDALSLRDSDSLRQVIAAALRPQDYLASAAELSAKLQGRGKAPLVISAVPVFHLHELGGQLAALLFAVNPVDKLLSRESALRAIYRLSPTEGRIAAALAGGSDLKEVAAELSITYGTARFHLKKIFLKTGARRQSDLVRISASLPAPS